MTRVVGSHFNRNDELKTTMNISKRLVALARKRAVYVVGVNILSNQSWLLAVYAAHAQVDR